MIHPMGAPQVLAFRPGKLSQQKAISAINTLVIDEPVQMYVPEITRDAFPSGVIVMTAIVGDVWYTDDGTLPSPGVGNRDIFLVHFSRIPHATPPHTHTPPADQLCTTASAV